MHAKINHYVLQSPACRVLDSSTALGVGFIRTIAFFSVVASCQARCRTIGLDGCRRLHDSTSSNGRLLRWLLDVTWLTD
jgi:hypothetical protein